MLRHAVLLAHERFRRNLAVSALLPLIATMIGAHLCTCINAFAADTTNRSKAVESAIIHAMTDPQRSGILGTISDEEIRVLCKNLRRELTPASTREYLTVVSPREPVSRSFKPWDLTVITSKDIPVQKTIELNREARDALVRMVKYINSHSRPNGARYKLVVVSGYRSSQYQSNLFERKVNSIRSANPKLSRAEAEKQAARVVAPPHESEHTLGTTVDFTTGTQTSKGGDILTNAIADTPEYVLMAEEAWKSGWVNSLRPGKEHLTGRMTEQWHWRYVGVPHAEIMWLSGWVPEEYRDYMREQRSIAFKSSSGELYWVQHDKGTGRILTSVAAAREATAEVAQLGPTW